MLPTDQKSPTDPLPRSLDSVFIFNPLSQPTSNRGHLSLETTKVPVGPPPMCVPQAPNLETSVPYNTHSHTCTHMCRHTRPITIPSHSAHALKHSRGPPTQGGALTRGVFRPLQLSCLPAATRIGPPQPAQCQVPGSPVPCVGRGGGREVQRRVKEWERGSERGRYKIKR